MRLLLTNDDGLDCDGIQSLIKTLSCDHEVWVVAPDRNRSAVSHGITMTGPLRLRRVEDQIFTCSGAPVDCTITALAAVLPEKPDAVISGINQGANIGTDVLYSGTAAAARQASLAGIPGIALSSVSKDGPWDFDALSVFVSENLAKLINLCEHDVFLNINAPSQAPFAGCRLTTLSKRRYCDTIKLYSAPDGHSYSFFAGGHIETEGDELCDHAAVEAGCISVSRVHAQPAVADSSTFAKMRFKV